MNEKLMAIDSATYPEKQPLPDQGQETQARMILILVAEERLAEVLAAYFDQEGYEVLAAKDSDEAAAVFAHSQPDVVIVDEKLQESWDFTSLVSADLSIQPVILALPGRSTPNGEIGEDLPGSTFSGLSPSPRELALHVQAALRRAGKSIPAAGVFRAGGVVLDRYRHIVQAGKRTIDLTPIEFDLLSVLIAAPSQVFTRTELRERVWGVENQASDRTIDVHIMNIRAKLRAKLLTESLIETVYRVGYRFSPD